MGTGYYQRNKAKWATYYETRRRKAPLYATWRSMLIRCGYIKGAKPHELVRYIGRGISVCNAWRNDFETFQEWALSHGWTKGLQLDRINNDGNYEPENCRFVTARQNACNRRDTIMVEYAGRIMPLREAYDLAGCTLNYKLVNNRVRKGWTLEKAFGGEDMKEKDALKIERLRKAFEEDFDSRFAGRKILKTALHAIGYCIMAENADMKERAYAEAWGGKYDRWIAYCKKTGTADTWCNSVEWYVTGKVEAAK